MHGRNPDDDRLTRGAVALALEVSVTRVDQYVAAGRLPYEQTPLGRLYRPEDVEQLRKQRAQAAAQRQPIEA